MFCLLGTWKVILTIDCQYNNKLTTYKWKREWSTQMFDCTSKCLQKQIIFVHLLETESKYQRCEHLQNLLEQRHYENSSKHRRMSKYI
jgi:hypothetical protein